MKKNIATKLKEVLEKTGYVKDVKIFEGEFHEDSRKDVLPYVSYIVKITNKNKETKLHELERYIRCGFYDGHYPDCDITTYIEEISETEERHTINVKLNGQSKEDKAKRVAKIAIHLRKLIEEYHFRG